MLHGSLPKQAHIFPTCGLKTSKVHDYRLQKSGSQKSIESSRHWAVDEVRRKVQKEWHAYDRKKMKRMRYIFHKDSSKLTDEDRWYLNRYLHMSPELKEAYTLKETYKKWKREAKTARDITEVIQPF